MGSLFSKSDKKIQPLDPRKTNSAPATLQNLDGTNPSKEAFASGILTPEASPSISKLKARNEAPSKAALQKVQSFDGPTHAAAAVRSPATPDLPPTKPVVQVPEEQVESAPSPSNTLSPTKRAPKKIDVIGDQTDGKKLAADLPAAVAIPDDALQWAQIYGESAVRNFNSSDWKEREHSLSLIQRSLGSSKFMAGKDPKAVYMVTAEMLAKTLRDKVAPIFHASLDLVSDLLASFSNQISQQVLHAGMDPIMPIIVHRCGNLNTRIHESSLQAILAVANFPNFGCSYVGPFALTEPPKRNRDASQAAQMYGRLDLVHSLLAAFRSTDGLPVEDVLKLSKQGLEMPDDKVRQVAIKVVVEMYKLQKSTRGDIQVERHLGTVKPALMQVLQKRFEEADAELASGVSSSGAAAGSNLPAVATGIKVFGKALPPLPAAAGIRMAGLGNGGIGRGEGNGLKPLNDPPWRKGPPRTAGGNGLTSPKAGPPRSPAPRSPAPRERMRMAPAAADGGMPGTPKTPPLGQKSSSKSLRAASPGRPDASMPSSTQMPGSRTHSKTAARPGSKLGSAGREASAFDDAEEQLIQYIMADEKAMS